MPKTAAHTYDQFLRRPLLYSGPEDPSARQHLTLRRSTDRGLHWRPTAHLTAPDTPAAYSDLTKISRTRLGILFATGTTTPYDHITWHTLPLTFP
ncbi:glycoside hydrolase [Streptomyces sp. NBC_01476]|uniref:sialidase family protein n=1 Tax=Streptomyces sp. NBC_01476 TaxID=2903881 RepID=UPI002E32DD71|nr:sialidase family protein [Streptomyces sp. NBC_01476]